MANEGSAPRAGFAEACAEAALGKLCALDAFVGSDDPHERAEAKTMRWFAGLEPTPPPMSSDAPVRLRARLAQARWLQLQAAPSIQGDGGWSLAGRAFGECPPSETQLAEAEAAARSEGATELVLHLAVARALADEHRGALDGARSAARRAWRMARTEGLPQSQYFAGLVLARLRRLEGRPHLATHILTSLSNRAPSPWTQWIQWELALAQGRSSSPLQPVLDAAVSGDRQGFDRHATAILQRPLPHLMARDRDDLLDALDASRAPEPGSEIHRWSSGNSPFEPPPRGLHGVTGASEDRYPTPTIVHAALAGPGRRCLSVGSRLAGPKGLISVQAGRAESLIAALALAGPDGLEPAELFRAAYGFRYDVDLHRGALDVALHRARERLDSWAHLQRTSSRIALVVSRPFAVFDPRSLPSAEDRLLGLLASQRELGARELAQQLDMPLRTVQKSLRELVEGGAAVSRRDGRNIRYAVEDTTFQEPTRVD